MTPIQHRTQLLYKILIEGVQPVEKSFALQHIFPDTTITAWAMQHGLTYHTESYPRLAGKTEKWEFICFNKLNDAEL